MNGLLLRKEYGFESTLTLALLLAQHFISYVTLVKSLNFSEPQLHNGIIDLPPPPKNCLDKLRKCNGKNWQTTWNSLNIQQMPNSSIFPHSLILSYNCMHILTSARAPNPSLESGSNFFGPYLSLLRYMGSDAVTKRPKVIMAFTS